MGLTPEVLLALFSGLVAALWGLLMWRLQSMEVSRKESREGMLQFYESFEAHTKEDREHFDSVKETMNRNHVELLGLLGNRRGEHGS